MDRMRMQQFAAFQRNAWCLSANALHQSFRWNEIQSSVLIVTHEMSRWDKWAVEIFRRLAICQIPACHPAGNFCCTNVRRPDIHRDSPSLHKVTMIIVLQLNKNLFYVRQRPSDIKKRKRVTVKFLFFSFSKCSGYYYLSRDGLHAHHLFLLFVACQTRIHFDSFIAKGNSFFFLAFFLIGHTNHE